MQLVYSDIQQTTIAVTLAEGERVGNFTGSATIYVPVAGGNAEYNDIVARSLLIDPYVPPA